MPPLFYQHYWSLVGNYITKIVLDFLNHGLALLISMKHMWCSPLKLKTPQRSPNLGPLALVMSSLD